MKMKSKRLILAFAISTLFAATAFASTNNGTISVSGVVIASCTITATPVNFGSVSSGGGVGVNKPAQATGTATVNCAAPFSLTTDSSVPLTIGGAGNGNMISVLGPISGQTNPVEYQNLGIQTANFPGDPSATIIPLVYVAYTGSMIGGGQDLNGASGVIAPLGTGAFSATVNLTINY
jgi:hypothetical protein